MSDARPHPPPGPIPVDLPLASGLQSSYPERLLGAATTRAFAISLPRALARIDIDRQLHVAGPMPHPALNSMFDSLYPPGDLWYWKADFIAELTDEAIARHVEFGAKIPTWQSRTHLYPVDGAAGRVANDATAWKWRDAKWCQVIVGVSKDPADKDRITAWARDYWEAVHPYSAGGAYVNMMMEEGQERVQASYGDNYDRLTAVKAIYDPTNLFQMNQNIRPRA